MMRGFTRRVSSATAATALLAGSAFAYTDSSTTMAPPIQPDTTQTVAGGPAYVTPNSVFNWTEMPRNQKVLITRAIFDQGGYQLYDSAGETIVVPFTNNNLYVMKFARSNDGFMYLVNEGDAPVLYVPPGGFLDNATVPDAHWYPFSEGFEPEEPAYMGIAPSWNDYTNMGWYPGMIFSGGFYSYDPFYSGAVFLPTTGFFCEFGNHRFRNFNDFRDFHRHHRAPFRMGFHDRAVYSWAHHPHLQRFTVAGQPYFAHRTFRGVRPQFFEHRTFQGRRNFRNHRKNVFVRPAAPNNRHAPPNTGAGVNERRTFPNSRPPVYQHRNFPGDRPRMNTRPTFRTVPTPTMQRPMFRTVPPPVVQQRTFRTLPPQTVQRPMFRTVTPPMVQRPMFRTVTPPTTQQPVFQNGQPMNRNQGVMLNPGIPPSRGMGGIPPSGGGHRGR